MGTFIQLTDLFSWLPVRGARNAEDVIEDTLRRIQNVSLLNPNCGIRVLTIDDSKLRLEIGKSTSIETRFAEIELKSRTSDALLKFEKSRGDFSAKGWVTQPEHFRSSKNAQHLYINGRRVPKSRLTNLVNHVSTLWFGDTDLSAQQELGACGKPRSFRWKSKKFPSFLLSISCPSASYDLIPTEDDITVDFRDWTLPLKLVYEAITHAMTGLNPLLSFNAEEILRRIDSEDFVSSTTMHFPEGINRSAFLHRSPPKPQTDQSSAPTLEHEPPSDSTRNRRSPTPCFEVDGLTDFAESAPPSLKRPRISTGEILSRMAVRSFVAKPSEAPQADHPAPHNLFFPQQEPVVRSPAGSSGIFDEEDGMVGEEPDGGGDSSIEECQESEQEEIGEEELNHARQRVFDFRPEETSRNVARWSCSQAAASSVEEKSPTAGSELISAVPSTRAACERPGAGQRNAGIPDCRLPGLRAIDPAAGKPLTPPRLQSTGTEAVQVTEDETAPSPHRTELSIHPRVSDESKNRPTLWEDRFTPFLEGDPPPPAHMRMSASEPPGSQNHSPSEGCKSSECEGGSEEPVDDEEEEEEEDVVMEDVPTAGQLSASQVLKDQRRSLNFPSFVGSAGASSPLHDKKKNDEFLIAKKDLGRVRLVAQVDEKFLGTLITRGDTGEEVLLAVDQHAADPSPPWWFSPTLLKLSRWGFRFREHGEELKVVEQPDILGRLLDPASTLEKLLGELEEFGSFAGMPLAIREVITSKACRNGIKFGDRLMLSESLHLCERLSQTTFPFFCAHGRPTIFPLASLGEEEERKGTEDEIRKDWLQCKGTEQESGFFSVGTFRPAHCPPVLCCKNQPSAPLFWSLQHLREKLPETLSQWPDRFPRPFQKAES
uniref:DNA mismatch repair protein S5 domain-containing protein n=1 Tax=Chromera velia CCMP2878 TaxID=1169474 RepID=A0A0G4FJU5_9ALVE|eukprot:Cvel_17421.t1-p1 / transcript=Cvel_17421.t1 / gene=Cvel_17421 / organism=Chromera_velia_CCMP2878 / gene_product=DNA mismatch repair protein Mlh3, putative / transcript_product=DNA mismatch repair protein Mlh3, putative / location=Cvel_scaffold1388:18753-22115(-) / protein_length=882 / sequence_SO=supercontig / SO=protein_coding / is_pseudo=false